MKKIQLIASVDENWGIGYDNELLFHLKQDMAYFKKKTMGNIVVMGRRTWESLPGKMPLPHRRNIVLTKRYADAVRRRAKDSGQPLFAAQSLEELEILLSSMEGDIFVIGGGEVYRAFLPVAEEVYLTRVEYRKTADTYFPCLERDSEWRVISVSEPMKESGVVFRFWHYRRVK